MKRRKIDPETKKAAVLEGLKGRSSVADICRSIRSVKVYTIGGLVLRAVDQRYWITEKVAPRLHDLRDSNKVKHDLLTLIRQRLEHHCRSYLTTLQVADNFFGEKTFKTELFMPECFQRVSRLRDCLLGDYSILAVTLSFFKNFS